MEKRYFSLADWVFSFFVVFEGKHFICLICFVFEETKKYRYQEKPVKSFIPLSALESLEESTQNSIPKGGETLFPLLCSCPDWALLVAQWVMNPPSLQETWVWSLGQEDLLEKGIVTHSRILAWRIPWTEQQELVTTACIKLFHLHTAHLKTLRRHYHHILKSASVLVDTKMPPSLLTAIRK